MHDTRKIQVVCGVSVAAILIGLLVALFPDAAVGVVIGLIALLPIVTHLRWVGWRRAFTEPTAVTLILAFYVSVFLQRGLVIAADDFDGVLFTRQRVTGSDLVLIMVLAAVATTILVEAFHRARAGRAVERRDSHVDVAQAGAEDPGPIVFLAALLGVVSTGALAGIVIENGGVAGTIDIFASHEKSLIAGSKTLATSVWATFSIPAIWCTARMAAMSRVTSGTKHSLLAVSALILTAQLVIFGSRLSAILAVSGAWVVWYYSGRRVRASTVLLVVMALFAVSGPILSARAQESSAESVLPTYARYSELAGYGILDISLAIHQEPESVRGSLLDSKRWQHLPAYLTPFWPDRPDFAADRIDRYVVQAFGTPNQQDSGIPPSFITEAWLLGGWLGVAFLAAVFGALLGFLHRKLIETSAPTSASVLFYALVATGAFSYYKDGDLLANIVADWRNVLYLAIAMFVTGVWKPYDASSLVRLPKSVPALRR